MASKCASKTLFVGNLHVSLEENDLLDIFRPFGRIVECCKRWCHYGFIQFATEDEARLAFNNLNGSKVRGRPMRIEFQRKKLRNIQALLEAEAEAKLHMHNTSGDGGGGSKTSFENLLSSLNCGGGGGNSLPSVLSSKNFANNLLGSSSSAASSISNMSVDLENINPVLLMNQPKLSTACHDLGLSKLGSLFKSSAQINSEEDEKLLFSNSMLLETCLLKVFDDDMLVDEPMVVPPTPGKEVLKSISLNTNLGVASITAGFTGSPINTFRSSKSPPDYNNNSNKNPKPRLSEKLAAPMDYYFSSSCSSPVSQKDSSSSSSSSVVIPAFKCKSSAAATSIYVEPNETNLEPLTEKDYPQYRLFPPTATSANNLAIDLDDDDKCLGASAVGDDDIYSPPLPLSSCPSSSPSSSCCSRTTSSSLNSPDYSSMSIPLQRRSSPFAKFLLK